MEYLDFNNNAFNFHFGDISKIESIFHKNEIDVKIQ
jgi:hypothetical protein